MYLFPYKKIFLETDLSSKIALQKIQDEVEPIKFSRLSRKNGKFFEGKIDNNNFHLRIPHISRSDSFNPQISGKIAENIHKTKISLTFGLNKFVSFFLAFLYILFLGNLLSILINFRITSDDLKFLGILFIFYMYIIYFWNRGYTLIFDKLVTIFHANSVSKESL